MDEPRRLSDKIAAAHAQACDQGKRDVARHLLAALETELSGFGGRDANERRAVDDMVAAAYQRQRGLHG
jgi:hypothetical protein